MSRWDVEQFVWQRLSGRKWLVGRRVCDRLTRRAIRQWDQDVPRLNRIAAQVEAEAREDIQMGVIAAWLLSALIQELVHQLWVWFNQSHATRCLMYGFQRELCHDDC